MGKHYMTAAVLLGQKGGDRWVVLHLLCQGIEIALKALLLLRDFDKYYRLLPNQKDYGHKLAKLAAVALAEYKLHPIRAPVQSELDELDMLYSKHLLRYDLLRHYLVDPASIACDRVVRLLLAAERLAKRKIKSSASSRATSCQSRQA